MICFAVAASVLRLKVTHRWQLLGLFVLFPCTFLMANLVGYTIAFAVLGVATPNIIGNDRHSPHAFTERQIGPFGTPAAIAAD